VLVISSSLKIGLRNYHQQIQWRSHNIFNLYGQNYSCDFQMSVPKINVQNNVPELASSKVVTR